GPSGPVILEYPAGQWMPAAVGGNAVEPAIQQSQGRPGQPVDGAGEIVVLRTGNEVRVALVGSGSVRASWRVQSATPLAEVQLAEPLGQRLLVVLRAYNDSRDEFVVLM